jgi:rRNA maturation RNase YbeY
VLIQFHNADTSFRLRRLRAHRRWIEGCIERYGKQAGAINFIFTSNPYLREINREYLNHNYFTDVITFDYSDGHLLSGDVFISLEKVKENARNFGQSMPQELRRVMIHGVLHLAGYKDASEDEKEVMRNMENEALHLWLKREEISDGI